MKVTLAQINTTPCDFEGNFNKIKNAIIQAHDEQSHMIVFPELTIPGYLTNDFMYSK